jgi:hypothetical protein
MGPDFLDDLERGALFSLPTTLSEIYGVELYDLKSFLALKYYDSGNYIIC